MSHEQFRCRAIDDYYAAANDELDLLKDLEYTIVQKSPTGWWYAVNDDGEYGWVLSNYLERIDEEDNNEEEQQDENNMSTLERRSTIKPELLSDTNITKCIIKFDNKESNFAILNSQYESWQDKLSFVYKDKIIKTFKNENDDIKNGYFILSYNDTLIKPDEFTKFMNVFKNSNNKVPLFVVKLESFYSINIIYNNNKLFCYKIGINDFDIDNNITYHNIIQNINNQIFKLFNTKKFKLKDSNNVYINHGYELQKLFQDLEDHSQITLIVESDVTIDYINDNSNVSDEKEKEKDDEFKDIKLKNTNIKQTNININENFYEHKDNKNNQIENPKKEVTNEKRENDNENTKDLLELEPLVNSNDNNNDSNDNKTKKDLIEERSKRKSKKSKKKSKKVKEQESDKQSLIDNNSINNEPNTLPQDKPDGTTSKKLVLKPKKEANKKRTSNKTNKSNKSKKQRKTNINPLHTQLSTLQLDSDKTLLQYEDGISNLLETGDSEEEEELDEDNHQTYKKASDHLRLQSVSQVKSNSVSRNDENDPSNSNNNTLDKNYLLQFTNKLKSNFNKQFSNDNKSKVFLKQAINIIDKTYDNHINNYNYVNSKPQNDSCCVIL